MPSLEEVITLNLRKKGRMNVDWTELPVALLLRIIENHLLSVDEYVAFSSVCRSWRYATLACDMLEMTQKWACQMPWLMLTDGNKEVFREDDINDTSSIKCHVFNNGKSMNHNAEKEIGKKGKDELDNLYRRSMLNLKQVKYYNFNCPQGYGRGCWGSSHGWIVTNGIDHDMYLFNPLTKARLDLPSRCTLPCLWKSYPNEILRSSFVDKAVILKVPSDVHGSDKTLLVVLLFNTGFNIAVAKPGDTHWTQIENTLGRIMDVLYHIGLGGLLFSTRKGNLAYCDLRDVNKEQPPTLRWYGSELMYIVDEFFTDNLSFVNHHTYIVNSGMDLLMVLRILDLEKNEEETIRDDGGDIDSYLTVDFKVYKFHYHDKSWEELHDLQDVALFVGNNATMSLCATDVGCERNCIYFTDDYRWGYSGTKDGLGGHDMGIFRMDDKVIQPFDVGNDNHKRSSYCSPFWFTPTL